jgi:hypothetical protein
MKKGCPAIAGVDTGCTSSGVSAGQVQGGLGVKGGAAGIEQIHLVQIGEAHQEQEQFAQFLGACNRLSSYACASAGLFDVLDLALRCLAHDRHSLHGRIEVSSAGRILGRSRCPS